MLTESLLWSNILLCPLVGGILLLRRSSLVSTLLLVFALCFMSGLTFIDLNSLQHPEQILFWRKSGLIFEVVVVLCCYFYTKTAFRDNSEIYKGPGFWLSVALALTLFVTTVVSPTESLLFSPDFADEQILFLTKSGFLIYLLMMVYLVFGLVQLERTLAGLHQTQRWGIKLMVLSSGLLLVSLALYFSQSLLYRSINMNYLAIRSAAVLIACLLLGYAHLYRQSDQKLALSRGIAHRSFVLLIVGGYLIVLGFVGEGLRYLNVTYTRQIFLGLLLLSIIALGIVFLSEKLRRKLKVILHKNFYQSKYDYQEQWKKFAERIAAGM